MEYYVIGGEFTSLNFHSFRPGTAMVLGPYDTRTEAESFWKELSAERRYQAGYRFIITEAKK